MVEKNKGQLIFSVAKNSRNQGVVTLKGWFAMEVSIVTSKKKKITDNFDPRLSKYKWKED